MVLSWMDIQQEGDNNEGKPLFDGEDERDLLT